MAHLKRRFCPLDGGEKYKGLQLEGDIIRFFCLRGITVVVIWKINWREPRLEVEETDGETALLVQVQVRYDENLN